MSPIYFYILFTFSCKSVFDNLPDEANVFICTCNVLLHFLGDPPPLSEGLDPPLFLHNKVFLLVNFRDVADAFYLKIDESSYSTKT